MKNIIHIAVAALTLGTLTLNAGPKEWVGKALPEVKVEFLDKAPDIKGKVAVVEFWATWCPPCRASIPHLNALNKKFKDKGVAIIGISDETKDVVAKFREKLPMEYTVALDAGGKFAEQFGISGIPHAFIVGKDGKIVWQGHPMQMKESDIEAALK